MVVARDLLLTDIARKLSTVGARHLVTPALLDEAYERLIVRKARTRGRTRRTLATLRTVPHQRFSYTDLISVS